MCYPIAILISHHALVMSTKRQAGNICLLLILNCLKTYIFELEKIEMWLHFIVNSWATVSLLLPPPR